MAEIRPVPDVENDPALLDGKTMIDPLPAAKETRFHTSRIRDSITVQKRRGYVNDDEEHEKNPHLEDFLVPSHRGSSRHFLVEEEGSLRHLVVEEEPIEKKQERPTLRRPKRCSLHGQECVSRLPCDKTEARRHVKFSTITVRDYGMILGDHPNCSYGPPVTLDWDYLEYEPLSVNDYEYHHALRRPVRHLNLSFYRRKELIEMAGTSEKEWKAATKEKMKAMRRRSLTRTFAPAQPMEAAIESACRKFKRLSKGEDHWKSERHLFAAK